MEQPVEKDLAIKRMMHNCLAMELTIRERAWTSLSYTLARAWAHASPASSISYTHQRVREPRCPSHNEMRLVKAEPDWAHELFVDLGSRL